MKTKPIKFNLKHQRILNSRGVPCSEIQLFKLGSFVHWTGVEFEVNEEFMESILRNFEAMKSESKDDQHVIPIDYNHGSLEYGADDSMAGGWISELAVKEDGLYAKVDWTDRAKALIREKEFRFVSPEFAIDAKDEFGEDIEGPALFAAALTNRPFLKGMAPVTLSKGKSNLTGGSKMKDKLIKLYSLAPDADELNILSAIKDTRDSVSKIEESLKCKSGEALTAITKLTEERDTLKNSLKEATDELVKQKESVKLAAAEAKVDALIKEKKIAAGRKDFYVKLAASSPETFDGVAKDLKVIMDEKTYGSNQGNSEDGDDLHAAVAKCSAENNISYIEALRRVQVERPDLTKKHINRSGDHPHLDQA